MLKYNKFMRDQKKYWHVYVFLLVLFIEFSLQIYSFSLSKIESKPLTGFKYVPYVQVLDLPFPMTKNYYKNASQIWLFGGSSAYGGHNSKISSWDAHLGLSSLSTELSKVLFNKNKKYTVHNFGQPSYFLHQERILFFELLFNNPKPRIVIFYDGVNEIHHSSPRHPVGTNEIKALVAGRQTPILFRRELMNSRIKTIYMLEQIINWRFKK